MTAMTRTEATVADAFRHILEVPLVTADSDFFALGGDSYFAVGLALALEERFDLAIPADLIEEVATVAGLAAWVDDRLRSGVDR